MIYEDLSLRILYLCNMKIGRILFLVFVALVISNEIFAQGCSQCKLLAEQGSELDEGSFGNGINGGILYLMAVPYLLIMFLFRKRIIRFFRQLFSQKSKSKTRRPDFELQYYTQMEEIKARDE